MKTLIKLYLMVCLSAISIQLSAIPEPIFQYKLEYLKSFALQLTDLENEPHYVHLKDQNNSVLHSEKIEDQAVFGRMYNLEDLPEGVYDVVIENEQSITIQPILVSQRFLVIDEGAKKKIIKPNIQIKDSYITINMLHFEKGKVGFMIKNSKKEIVYENQFKVFGSLNKRLNIKNLPQGNYHFIVDTDNYKVYKDFSINQTLTDLTVEF